MDGRSRMCSMSRNVRKDYVYGRSFLGQFVCRVECGEEKRGVVYGLLEFGMKRGWIVDSTAIWGSPRTNVERAQT